MSDDDNFPGEPREPGWGMWLLMGLATLSALAGVIGSMAEAVRASGLTPAP